jgi:hypothetical protein
MKNAILRRKVNRKSIASVCLLSLVVLTVSACKKLYNLPDANEFISNNINYDNKVIEPVLGRWNLHGGINTDNSSLPLKFEIVNARFGDGRPVTDLFQVKPTYVWTAAYTGLETSLEEIESKRKLEDHPLFEVRSSGEFILWASSSNALITPRPIDSSNLVQDIRFFDLKISNTGGERLIRDFQVRPFRERPYSPDNDINHYTGEVARDPKDPKNPGKRDYIRPSRFDNVIGETTNINLYTDDNRKDLVVYIRQFEGGNGHSLRFKFLDKDSLPINPLKFNETRWEQLVHGFNLQKTAEYVQYDVAYPIPLVTGLNTRFTDGGNAKAMFSYSRKGFGGGLTTATFGLNFRIYKEGNWEIVFHFKNDNPKFEDE